MEILKAIDSTYSRITNKFCINLTIPLSTGLAGEMKSARSSSNRSQINITSSFIGKQGKKIMAQVIPTIISTRMKFMTKLLFQIH